MNRSKREPKNVKKVYSIIVDGRTERWYFQKMKEYEKLPKIDIKPELPKRKKLTEQFNLVGDNAKVYDKVIWILDLDVLIKEENERNNTKPSIMDKFKKYVKDLKKYNNVVVLVNTPCLEFWFLLHCKETSKSFSNCKSVLNEIKKSNLLQDYEKSEKYFKNQNNNIYKRLKSKQYYARTNAKKLGDFDVKNFKSAKAEIYKIFDILGIE